METVRTAETEVVTSKSLVSLYSKVTCSLKCTNHIFEGLSCETLIANVEFHGIKPTWEKVNKQKEFHITVVFVSLLLLSFCFSLLELQEAVQSQKFGAGSKAQTTSLQNCIRLRLGIEGGGQIRTTAEGWPGFRDGLKVRLQDGAVEDMWIRIRWVTAKD